MVSVASAIKRYAPSNRVHEETIVYYIDSTTFHLIEYGIVLKQESYPFESEIKWDTDSKSPKLTITMRGNVYSRTVDGEEMGLTRHSSSVSFLIPRDSVPARIEHKLRMVEYNEYCCETPHHLSFRDAKREPTPRGMMYIFPEVSVEVWKGKRHEQIHRSCDDQCRNNHCTLLACFDTREIDGTLIRIAAGRAKFGISAGVMINVIQNALYGGNGTDFDTGYMEWDSDVTFHSRSYLDEFDSITDFDEDRHTLPVTFPSEECLTQELH